MIIVLFHVLYLLGKFVYQKYRVKQQKIVDDIVINSHKRLDSIGEECAMKDSGVPEVKCLRFFPPAYVQRYVAVTEVLNNTKYQGKLRKVVDFGCAELEFLVYLKNIIDVEEILCVDIDRSLLETYKDKGAPLISEYLHTREIPLVIEVCEGSVTHNDKKLEKTDAVICIELIEHLYPDTLADLPYNIFGFIKPKLVVITTPNADFNVLFPNFSGFRHFDHKFEWTRQQFRDWAENITLRYPDYVVAFSDICKGPEGTEHLGACTQMAVFHRLSEKDSCNIGIEGLFKTVAVYEYPFHVDNRSDEQKILDAATYYIRYLSYQDYEMEEEVPLKNVLDMLISFRISLDALKTILEEAGWSIQNRESGPVVLLPPRSTFSDYSAPEQPFWSNDYSVTDEEDDWNQEPGPPGNSNRFLEEGSYLDNWDNQNWDEEPSIVIPQNNSIIEDNTYLFDENVLLDSISDTSKDAEISEKCTETGNKENSGVKPSLSHTQDMWSSVYNPSLNFQEHISISRASTSPEPYLLQTVQIDQHLKNDSMCNESMSACWVLNNSFQQVDLSKDNKCKELSSVSESDNYDNVHSIDLNMSYKESDSDFKDLNNSTNASIGYVETQSVQRDNNISKEESELKNNVSFTSSCITDNQPKFTSSPKVNTKMNITGSVRRFLDCSKQKSNNDSFSTMQQFKVTKFTSNNSLESCSEVCSRSDNFNIHTLKCSTVRKLHDETENPMYEKDKKTLNDTTNNSNDNTFTSSDTLTIASTLNDDKQTTKESHIMNSLNSDDGVNFAMINTEQQSIKSIYSGERLILEEKSHADIVYEEDKGKTESQDIRENVDSTETSCNNAKDVSNLKSLSLVSSSYNVQSASVLKNEEQAESKDGSSNVEVLESTEAKPSPEEGMETPPNSWSPEVMDSGYPNSASSQDMTPEYDLSSIAQDHISDSEPPSIAEAPRVVLRPVEVENGDLANNNRDGEGNNMIAAELNELE